MIKIKKSDERILNILPEGILIVEIESNQILFANEYMCNTIGYSPSDFIQFSLFDIHPIKATKNTIHHYSKLLNNEIDSVKLIPVISKEKKIIYFDVTGKKIIYKEKNCFLGTFRNATSTFEKKEEINSLLTNLSDIKKALDQSAIIAIADSKGIILDANDKFCSLSKYSHAELIGQNHRIINSGVHPGNFFTDLWKCISSGNTWHGEICNKAKDGTLYWVDTTIVPFLDSSGQPEQYISIRFDITSKKTNEQKLKKEEARLISFISSIDDFLFEIDEDFRFLNVWVKDEALLFMPRKDFIGKILGEIFPKDFVDMFEKKIVLALNTNTPTYIEYPSIIPGDPNWYGASFSKIETEPGEKKKISIIISNISARRENALKLKESEELYRLITENTNDWICLNKLDGTIIYSSPSSLSITGYEPQELLGKNLTDFYHPEDYSRLKNYIFKKETPKEFWDKVEYRFIRKDAGIVCLETTGKPIFDGQNNLIQFCTATRDISDRKRIREQLIAAEKIAKIGSWEFLFTEQKLFWSDEMYNIFEFNPEKTKPSYKIFLSLIHPEDDKGLKLDHPDNKTDKLSAVSVIRLTMKDGSIKYARKQSSVFYDEQGKPSGSIGTLQDITELHQTQLELNKLNNDLEQQVKIRTENYLTEKLDRINIEKEKKHIDSNYKMLFEQIPLGVIVFEYNKLLNSFFIKDINEAACNMEKTIRNNVINKKIIDIYPNADKTGFIRLIESVYLRGISIVTPPRYYKDEHFEGWREGFVYKLITNEVVMVFNNITEKVLTEQNLKKSLAEKEILLNEVHHRVKNNLQIIIGLMQMQGAAIKEVPAVNEFLLQSGNRIKAMGLIHETIYQTGQYSGINIVSYIESLYSYLRNAIGKPQIEFKIETEIDEISISDSSAFGIVLNEIITNSLKYAFPENTKGEISVSIKVDNNENIHITIKDNGIGVKTFKKKQNGLGIELIFGLIKQIKAEVKMETFPSFKYSIKIPIVKTFQDTY